MRSSAETNRPLAEGEVALVTGASRGMGAATARAFVGAGAAVVLAARSETELTELADEIVAAGGKAVAVPTDVTGAAAYSPPQTCSPRRLQFYSCQDE